MRYYPRHAKKAWAIRLIDWALEALTGEVPTN
jgi:hypothetical protein